MVDSKEQFVRKMNDIRTRTLVERDNLTADQVRGMTSPRRFVLRASFGRLPNRVHLFYPPSGGNRGATSKRDRCWTSCSRRTTACASRSSTTFGGSSQADPLLLACFVSPLCPATQFTDDSTEHVARSAGPGNLRAEIGWSTTVRSWCVLATTRETPTQGWTLLASCERPERRWLTE